MARAQSLEKERDKALKEVEVKNEVIKCLEEMTGEDVFMLNSLKKIYFYYELLY